VVDGSDKPPEPVTRKTPTGFQIFCLAVIIFVAAAVEVSHRPPEPIYNRLGLSHWLGGMVSNGPGSSGVLASGRLSSLAEVGSALGSVGPEALPWLVSALPGLEFRQRFDAWCSRTANRSSSPLVNRLLLKLTDPHSYTGYANTCSLLARFAPGSPFQTKAFRAFVPHRPGDDTELVKIRLWALGRCTNSPDKAIPILISELTNSLTVDRAVDGVANFGSLATPRLYPLALGETGMIRPAEVALERADPLAYKRLREEKERRGIR
jgi:hypothetical protein